MKVSPFNTDYKIEYKAHDRRLSDRRVSPAIGEHAIQECARLRESNKELLAALKQTVWIARPEFPGDPYCALCGAGKKWAAKHGHQKQCAISKATS